MPTRRTKAGASSRYGRDLSRRQCRRVCAVFTGLAPLLDTGFLEHLVDLDARLLERVGRGHALEVDLVQRASPDVAQPRALGLWCPRHPGRFEVLRDDLQIAAAAPRPHDLLDARVVGDRRTGRIVVAIADGGVK